MIRIDTYWSARVGAYVCIYRTDGSHRRHSAICTDISDRTIGLRSQGAFAVGEVVELAGVEDNPRELRSRARVLYHASGHYGVVLLDRTAENKEHAAQECGYECRLSAARKLLAQLKAGYDALPAVQRRAVRDTLAAANPEPGLVA